MPSHDMSPLRTALAGLVLLAVGVRGYSQEYCSTENTADGDTLDPSIYNSYLACTTHCSTGYAFAVVQYQSCWCSNYAPSSQTSVGSCSQSCPGYPSDLCGNADQGLFGYVALGSSSSGTTGATPGSTSSTTENSSSSEPSSSLSSSSSSSSTSSILTTSSTTLAPVIVPVAETSSTSTARPSPVASIQVVTLSGAIVTQTVTSTPTAIYAGGDSQDTDVPLAVQRQGLSGGAIAGAVVGGLVGLAVIALAAFLLWRRKPHNDSEEDAKAPAGKARPRRNISVLSKSGLLAHARPPSMAEREDETIHNNTTSSSSVRHSMILGGFAAPEATSPSSVLGNSGENSDSSRRNSRPLVYDQRLNPSALFANAEANGSRVSMQDQQDYSRPLGVTNPDLRASFDSR